MKQLLFLALTAAVGCGPPGQIAVEPVSTGGPSARVPSTSPELVPVRATPVVAPPAGPPAAADWPCFRGPNGNGISRETAWSHAWPATGPKKLWEAKLGTGYSSIAVAGGRVYSMGYRRGNDVVWCFDAATGEKLWEYSYPCALVDNLHSGGPGATPTVDGGRVYTLSREGQLHCLDAAEGGVIFTVKLAAEFGVKMPEWGFTASPLIKGESLYLDVGCICALDKTSGEVRWKTEPFSPGYGSVAWFPGAKEDRRLAVLTNDALVVVAADDGKILARTPWKTDYATNSTTPICVGEQIFVSTGYGRGCGLFTFAPGKLEEVYELKTMANHFNNSVLWKGQLYGIDGNSHASSQCRLACIDFGTGAERWKQRGFGCGSLLISADGRMIVLSDAGELVVARANPDKFEELARATILEGQCWTVPVLAGGRIYARNTAGTLVCLDVAAP